MANIFSELVEDDILQAEIFEDLNPTPVASGLVVTQLSSLSTGSDDTQYTTVPAYLPAADALMVADIVSRSQSGSPESPSQLTGNGLTWDLVDFIDLGSDRRLSRYRSMGGSPSLGALTIDFPGTQTAIIVNVHQVSGVNTSGVNGSGAVGLTSKISGNGDTMSLALSPPIDGSIVSFASSGGVLTSDPDFCPVNMDSLLVLAMNVDFDQGTQLTYTGNLVSGDFAGIMTEIIKA